MSVIITIVIWCWPRILDIFECNASMQKHLTSDWGWPAVPSCPITALELWHVCVPVYKSVSCFLFSAGFNFAVSYLDPYSYITSYWRNREIMNGNTETYSVLKLTAVLRNWSIGSLQWEDFVRGFEGCRASGSTAIHFGS